MPRTLTFTYGGSVLFGLACCCGCGVTPSPRDGPRITDYSNSGCLPGTSVGDDQAPGTLQQDGVGLAGCGEDEFVFAVEGTTLQIAHQSATYNCCPDDIAITVSVDGATLRFTEEQDLTSGGCFCTCCYDVEATVEDLASGEYSVEFCWQDYETDFQRCHTEDILVP